MVRWMFGVKTEAAAEDEVRTKRFTVGEVAEACRAAVARFMAVGITIVGSGLKDTSLATWATPETSMVLLVNITVYLLR